MATISPTSSVWSLDSFNSLNHNQLNKPQQKQMFNTGYFEPLPFNDTKNPAKQNVNTQLSVKHKIIRQSMVFKNHY